MHGDKAHGGERQPTELCLRPFLPLSTHKLGPLPYGERAPSLPQGARVNVELRGLTVLLTASGFVEILDFRNNRARARSPHLPLLLRGPTRSSHPHCHFHEVNTPAPAPSQGCFSPLASAHPAIGVPVVKRPTPGPFGPPPGPATAGTETKLRAVSTSSRNMNNSNIY